MSCRLSNREVSFICIQSAAAAAAATAALCVAILLLLLLLPAAIRHRAPDGQFAAGSSLNLIPVFSFSSFKRDLFLEAPLGSIVSHLFAASIYLHPR